MLDSIVLVDVLIRERQLEMRRLAAYRALRRVTHPVSRRRALRARLGLMLIQGGRALLRHRPAVAVARRHAA
jgi:hypothetical protein